MFLLRKIISSIVSSYPARRTTNGISSAVNTFNTNTLTVNYPSGSSNGDLIIIQIHGTMNPSGTEPTFSISGPSWTLIQTETDTVVNLRYSWYWAFRGSETSITITGSPSTNFNNISASMIAYDGSTVDVETPIGVSSSVYADGGSNSTDPVSTSSVTTTVNNSELLLMSIMINTTSTDWSGTDVIEVFDTSHSSAGTGSTYVHSIAYAQQAVAGATGSYSADPTGSGRARGACIITIQPTHVGPPVVISTATGFGDTNASSTSIPMDAGALAGDLNLVLLAANGINTLSTASSGWTKIGQWGHSSGDTIGLFAGIQGSSADPVIVANNPQVHRAWIRYTIRGAGPVSNIEIGTAATGSSTTHNPPALTPTHGSQPYLWLVTSAGTHGNGWPTAAPSGFSTLTQVRCNSSTFTTTHVSFGAAWKQEVNSTLDPGTMSAGASSAWSAQTIAIPPPL